MAVNSRETSTCFCQFGSGEMGRKLNDPFRVETFLDRYPGVRKERTPGYVEAAFRAAHGENRSLTGAALY